MNPMPFTGSSKKNPAKFGDTCSVRADGLCIGCLVQWAERGRENTNMQEFFHTTLYYGGLPFAHGISYENGSKVFDDWCDFGNIFILMISSSLPNKNYQLKKFSIPVMKIVQKSHLNLLLWQ